MVIKEEEGGIETAAFATFLVAEGLAAFAIIHAVEPS